MGMSKSFLRTRKPHRAGCIQPFRSVLGRALANIPPGKTAPVVQPWLEAAFPAWFLTSALAVRDPVCKLQ